VNGCNRCEASSSDCFSNAAIAPPHAYVGLLQSMMSIVRDTAFWVVFPPVRRSCLALEINPLLVTGSHVEALDVLVNWQA
jgi:hypothetical protein